MGTGNSAPDTSVLLFFAIFSTYIIMDFNGTPYLDSKKIRKKCQFLTSLCSVGVVIFSPSTHSSFQITICPFNFKNEEGVF